MTAHQPPLAADDANGSAAKGTPPARTPYQRGKDFQRRVRDLLRSNGYEVVESAGSKTKIDQVAVKPGQVLFVQCKRNGALPPAEWNRLYDLAAMLPSVAVPVVASQNGARGGIRIERLAGRKTRPGAREPREPFAIDQLTEVRQVRP